MITPASLQQNLIVCRFRSNLSEKRLKNCSQWAVRCEILTKNPHAGEIGEGENDLCLLKRNKTKSSHTDEIGKGESDVHLLSGMKNENVQNDSVQYKGYSVIGVTTVERGDCNYDSNSLFLYIRQLL